MNRPWLKAGLIGGLVLVIINLFGLIPMVSCICMPLGLVAYVAIGALAARWVAPRREAGRAAGQGALAGVVSGLIGGIASTVLAPVSLAMAGGPQAFINNLPPESLQAFQQAGVDPQAVFSGGALALLAAICCLPLGMLLGAGLGALGGVIYAAIRPGQNADSLEAGPYPPLPPAQ